MRPYRTHPLWFIRVLATSLTLVGSSHIPESFRRRLDIEGPSIDLCPSNTKNNRRKEKNLNKKKIVCILIGYGCSLRPRVTTVPDEDVLKVLSVRVVYYCCSYVEYFCNAKLFIFRKKLD